MAGHAGWEAAAWPMRVQAMVDAQQFEQLVHEVSQRDGISLVLPEAAPATPPTDDPAQTAAMDSADPGLMAGMDNGDPTVEFAAYWRAGNTVAAQRVVDEAVAMTQWSGSAELWRLKTAVAVHNADWKSAWLALDRWVHLTHPAELP